MNNARPATAAIGLSTGLLIVAALHRSSWPPLLSAPLLIATGIAAAALVAGAVTWLSVTSGALSALLWWALAPHSPMLAYWGLTIALYVPRTALMKSRAQSAGHAVVSAAVTAGSAWVFGHYLGSPLHQHVASSVFAGAMLSIPLLIFRADSPLEHLLRSARQIVPERASLDLQALITELKSGKNKASKQQIRKLVDSLDEYLAGEDQRTDENLQQLMAAISSSLNASDKVVEEESKASDEVAADESKASDEVAADESKASDEVAADESKASDEVATDESKASDEVAAEFSGPDAAPSDDPDKRLSEPDEAQGDVQIDSTA